MNAGWKADPLQAYSLDELLGKYIVLYNSCISRASAGIHIGIRRRRGNLANSRHFSGGDHDRIAMKLFQELKMHIYYLEYDAPRVGGFEPR